jgi:phosphoribosylamine--glycine ligase
MHESRKILIVGGGGREHALAWRIAHDAERPRVFCAPGNAGTAAVGANIEIDSGDIEELAAWARINQPALTVVGPEAPLCAGIADRFRAEGLKVFGPSKAAARIEGSKVFAKEIMTAAGVPTAGAESFTDAARAKSFVRKHGAPVVVKADGLAAGKGVTVAATVEEAEAAIDEAVLRRAFGESGRTVLVEECLAGEEASILALVDGRRAVMLASAQDHKRALDGDGGPNTGGMGAYSPAPVVSDRWWPLIREQVFDRTLKELGRRGIEYRGVLYAGLMMTAAGPKVLEFNCRFGDPETQAILPRFSGDLLPALEACADGRLAESLVRWRSDASACVVMAAGGYPGTYRKGDPIRGLPEAAALDGVLVFHAGTKRKGDAVVTAGGRVLGITALGPDLESAVRRAYAGVRCVGFDGAHYRTDIGWRALAAAGRGGGV